MIVNSGFQTEDMATTPLIKGSPISAANDPPTRWIQTRTLRDDPTASATDPSDGSAATMDATEEARQQVSLGVWASGVRCMLVYVIAPLVGGFGSLIGAIGLALQVLGALTCVAGALTLWRTAHRARLPYAVLACAVVLTTAAAILTHH